MILCPLDIISRMGQTGISITPILATKGQPLSLSLSRRLVFFYENKSVSEAPYVCIISSSFYCVTCVDYLWRGDPIDKGVFTVLTYSCW